MGIFQNQVDPFYINRLGFNRKIHDTNNGFRCTNGSFVQLLKKEVWHCFATDSISGKKDGCGFLC
jgi:hypothetical protein